MSEQPSSTGQVAVRLAVEPREDDRYPFELVAYLKPEGGEETRLRLGPRYKKASTGKRQMGRYLQDNPRSRQRLAQRIQRASAKAAQRAERAAAKAAQPTEEEQT